MRDERYDSGLNRHHLIGDKIRATLVEPQVDALLTPSWGASCNITTYAGGISPLVRWSPVFMAFTSRTCPGPPSECALIPGMRSVGRAMERRACRHLDGR